MAKTLLESMRQLGVGIGDERLIDVATCVVRHVVGVDNAYKIQADLKKIVDFRHLDVSAQKFRLGLLDMSYVHLNLKYFCLNLLHRGVSLKNLREYSEAFEIDRNDVVLIKRVLRNQALRAELREHRAVADVDRDTITPKAFKTVFGTFSKIYPDIFRHIKHKTYNKLRFISVSSNIEFYDLHMELVHKALQTYIKLVPTTASDLYIANYIRKTLNNHTTNIIKAYTSQKRGRMVKGASDGFGGNTFDVTVLSENQLFRAFGIENISYETLRSGELNSEEEHIKESNISYELILRRFGKTKRQRLFIELIAGQENHRFTSYLRRMKLIAEDQDNVDLQHRCEIQYFKAICSFLDVAERRARGFMGHIAKRAYPERFASEKNYGTSSSSK